MTLKHRLLALLGIAVIGAVIYFFLRLLYQTNGMFATASIPLAAIFIVGVLQSRRPGTKDLMDFVGLWLNFIAVVVIFLFVFSNHSQLGKMFQAWPIGSILLCFAVGYCFFLFKQKKQFYYGIAELFFGLLLFGQIALTVEKQGWIHSDSTLVQLFAGIYVVVRGLDNMNTGVKDRGPILQFTASLFRLDCSAWKQFRAGFSLRPPTDPAIVSSDKGQ